MEWYGGAHLEYPLVEVWQQEDEQVECADLLLQVLNVRNTGKRREVLPSQQRYWEVPGEGE